MTPANFTETCKFSLNWSFKVNYNQTVREAMYHSGLEWLDNKTSEANLASVDKQTGMISLFSGVYLYDMLQMTRDDLRQ